MKFRLVILLFNFCFIPHGSTESTEDILNSIKDDLMKLKKTCGDDYCTNSDGHSPGVCHCDVNCAKMGTCCYDSPYANTSQLYIEPFRFQYPNFILNPTCRQVYGNGYYFVIDKCPFLSDGIWADQCNDEMISDGDILKLAPVTSLVTNMTYKNYYCFRCYEATDQFLHWTLNVQITYFEIVRHFQNATNQSFNDVNYIYDKNKDRIMATLEDTGDSFPVGAFVGVPSQLQNLVHFCEPDIITDCPQGWPNMRTRKKCHLYMAVKRVERVGQKIIKYKNFHCALCNYENINNIKCDMMDQNFQGFRCPSDIRPSVYSGVGPPPFVPTVKANPIRLIIDIRERKPRSRNKKCSDNEIWNPFARKCKKLSCIIEDFVVKDGRCVPK